MKRACIFDFDGVIIDNERFWEEGKTHLYHEVYGEVIAKKLNKTLGLNMDAIHELATTYGSTVPVTAFYDACNRHAKEIYAEAPITKGLDTVIETLVASGFSLGIVSASPKSWIDIALNRMPYQRVFQAIISLHDRLDLAHKPAPDGYVEAMRILGVRPPNVIVIEDSKTGIASAKASGAYTIGLKQNLVDGYTIEGADMYVDRIEQISTFASTFRKSN